MLLAVEWGPSPAQQHIVFDFSQPLDSIKQVID